MPRPDQSGVHVPDFVPRTKNVTGRSHTWPVQQILNTVFCITYVESIRQLSPIPTRASNNVVDYGQSVADRLIPPNVCEKSGLAATLFP
jgi:hypothetical protein